MEDSACWGLSEDLQELMNEFLPDVGDNWDSELELGSVKGLCNNIAEGNALPTANLKELTTDIPSTLWDDLLGEKTQANITTADLGTGLFDDIDLILDKMDELDETSHKTTDSTTVSSLASSPASSEFSNSMTPPHSPPSFGTDSAAASCPKGSSVEIVSEGITYKIITVVEPYTPPHTPEQTTTSSEVDSSSNSSNPRAPAHDSKPYGRGKRHSKKVQPKTVVCSNNKKTRKRDQNRDAATRYRLKKRAEAETISKDEGSLEQKNRELRDHADRLSSEIKYLKGLLKEIVIAKIKS